MNKRSVGTWCLLTWLFAVSCGLQAVGNSGASQGVRQEKELRTLFENRYQVWLEAREEWIRQNRFLSYTPLLPEGEAILHMGPAVVPFIIEKIEQDLSERKWDNRLRSSVLGLLSRITKKRFRKSEWPEATYGRHDTHMELYVRWWKEGRKETPRKFAALYAEWDKFLRDGKTDKAEKTFDLIRSMGIEVLPLVMEKIQQSDNRLVPLVSKITRKKVGGDKPTRASVLDWWKANQAALRFPEPLPKPSKK